jgi:Fe-S-cluster containining protein
MPDNNHNRFALEALGTGRMLPFTCLGSECPNTCCGPFHGTRALQAILSQDDLGPVLGGDADVDADRVSIFAQIRLTEEDVHRIQEAGLDHFIVRRGTVEAPHYYMKLKPDGSCSALANDGLCSIHSHRPTICRAFPFYIDMFAGLAMISSCPGVGAGEQPVEALETEIAAAIDIYGFWIEQLRQIGKKDEPR